MEEAAARPGRATVEAAGQLVTLARELAIDVELDAAQERIHEALRRRRHRGRRSCWCRWPAGWVCRRGRLDLRG